jgi:hypothetical protein
MSDNNPPGAGRDLNSSAPTARLHMNTNTLIKRGILLGGMFALTAPSAMAAWSFPNGNLLLGFQATGGTGSTVNVFFDLGSAVAVRDNGAQGVVGNISTDLVAAFGSNWFNRSDLYFGVVGNLNAAPTTGIGSAAPVNGDPSRTLYVSAPTIEIGGGALHTGLTSNSLGVAGNNFSGQEAMVRTLNPTGSGAAVLNSSDSVNWANGWTSWNTVGGSSYSTLSGIQDSFGQGGSINYIDIQRILATSTGANPTGTVGSGTWEATVGIGSDGSIHVIPEPSSAVLAGLAGLAGVLRRRRRSNA